LGAFVALGVAASAACDVNVSYLGAGEPPTAHGGGGHGGTAGSGDAGDSALGGSEQGGVAGGGKGGQGGTHSGGTSNGGSSPIAGSSSLGGTGALAGFGGSNGDCVLNPAVRDVFDFSTGSVQVFNDSQFHLAAWGKGAWDSTDLATGATDVSLNPQPPDHASNLANVSKLLTTQTDGKPSPSLTLTVAFSGKVSAADEHMHVLYAYAACSAPQ